jgi:transposase
MTPASKSPVPLPQPTVNPTPAQGLFNAERIRMLDCEKTTIREEREILRKAANYFAEETNWSTAFNSLMTIDASTRSNGYARS